MQVNEQGSSAKPPQKKVKASSKRLSPKTEKLLSKLLGKCNKKSYGKKVRADQLICAALELITDIHIKKLQEESLSNADKFEKEYSLYVKKNGAISKDEFLGVLLSKRNIDCDDLVSTTAV